jgi:hypothetical protein
MARVVQLTDGSTRCVALVDEPALRVIEGVSSVYELATLATESGDALSGLAQGRANGRALDYDEVYAGRGAWRLLAPIDHPVDPARCMVSGTGLTHFGSARDRDAMHAGAMHAGAEPAEQTDSLKMFQAGVEHGRPGPGEVGIAPEWFYKGVGTMLRGHDDALIVPRFAEGGGEEAEIAGIYVIAADGTPCRVGLATGNEFSDHRFERRNYLNLAGSKLRSSAIGPELTLAPAFDAVPGEVWIERRGTRIWSRAVASGEAEMSHSLRNIEHHHFKFEGHRRPGDLHVHFFGAPVLSFSEQIRLRAGDVMAVQFDGFGRALRNPLMVVEQPDALVAVQSLA